MFGRILWVLAGSIGSVLVVEAILRVLPVATGYDFLPLNAYNPVLRGTPYKPYTYSQGWNFRLVTHGFLNNDGFIASRDYGRVSAGSVLLIGDSFVQAAAVPRERNLHALLSARLQPIEVFGLYRSGGSLPDYLAMAGWGLQRYASSALVFVIASGDVEESLLPKESGYVFVRRATGYEQTRVDRSAHGTLGQLLNRSRLFRYLYDNLAFTLNFPVRSPPVSIAVSGNPIRLQQCRQVSLFFLTQLEHLIEPGRVVLLINRNRRNGTFIYDTDINVLADLARERGFQVIDLGPPFTQYEARTWNRLDSWPIDTHWNVLAEEVVADEVTPSLRAILGK